MEKQVKILLVDDEADFIEPLAFWLKSKGYSVMTASSGESAIKIVKENTPDIVFLDLNMPVMNGVETLKRIREFKKEIPAIMLSAYVEDPRMTYAYSNGISGVFYKGKDFSELVSLLDVALRHIKT